MSAPSPGLRPRRAVAAWLPSWAAAPPTSADRQSTRRRRVRLQRSSRSSSFALLLHGRGLLLEAEGGRRELRPQLNDAVLHLRLEQLQVLDVDDALELADDLRELGELVVVALDLHVHGNARVDLTRLLFLAHERDDLETGQRG